MTDYIVDTSVIIQHFITEPFTQNADRLFDSVDEDYSLHIPEFCLVECVNVFWKQVRFQSLPLEEAEIMMHDLLTIPFTILPVEDLLPRALQIGLAHKLAVYDSVYIALTERYKFPLITADAKQETAARTVGVTIKPITDF